MPNRQQTILMAVYSLGQGGTDRVCAYLARGLADAGFQTEVVIFCSGGKASDALLPLFGDKVRLTILGRASRLRIFDLARYFSAFVRRIRAVRPTVLISTGNNMNWVSALGLAVSGLDESRLVLKTTNPIIRPQERSFKAWFRKAGYARAFDAADRVLTLSDAETAGLVAAFPRAADRFRTVVNPYVTDAMLQAGPETVEPGLVIGVGRLARQKRFDLLLRGFAMLQHPGARLVLLGEGPDRAALEALARDLGIADRVEMPGFVTDVASWYRRANLMVLSSRYEGLPAVVLEAMAANCRVISTDCFPAARELVGKAHGCDLLDLPDPARLAAAIARQLGDSRPVELRPVARQYSVANAVQSHVDEVLALLTATTRLPVVNGTPAVVAATT